MCINLYINMYLSIYKHAHMYVCLHLCVFRDEWIDGYEDIQVQSKGYIYTIQRLDIYTIQMFCY